MIFRVEDAVFAPGAELEVEKLSLLRNAARRRHTLLVLKDPYAAAEKQEQPDFDRWRDTLAKPIRREVDLLLESLRRVSANAVARGAEYVLVLRQPGANDRFDGCCLSVGQAVRLASLPLFVLVENAINDGQFLRVVMPPAWRNRLREWEESGELCFENGGGVSVMKKIVERFADDEQPVGPFGLPPAAWRAAHFVLFDHDGDRRSSPGVQAKILENACLGLGLKTRRHMLKRRNQESYLPREALEQILGQKNLPDFKEDLAAHYAKPEEIRHFAKLPKQGRKDLFKNEFGTLTDSPDDWFENEGCWPEMTALAEKIAAVI